MKHLAAEHLSVLREKLVAEGSALGERIRRARLSPQSRDGDAADITRFDRDTDMLWEFEEQGCDRLLGIDEALQRMAQGTYGACDICKRDIPLARLLAVPGARYCVACQQKAEAEAVATTRPPADRDLPSPTAEAEPHPPDTAPSASAWEA